MNLIVDSGNTCTKIAVIDGERLLREWRFREVTPRDIEAIIAEYAPDKAIVASTCGNEQRICKTIEGRVGYLLRMSLQTPVPITIDYESSETLGVDRIATATGAVAIYGECDMVVIDCGTAITIDLIEGGVFKGGNISPGLKLRFKSLHEHTAHLPECDVTEIGETLGRSTRMAIEQGVMQGVLYELSGYVDRFLQKNPNIRIFFCGGDAKCFVNRIKNAIFADCNIMFTGLNSILEYNATNYD